MYSFQPLIDNTATSHNGFYFWCIIAAFLVFIVLSFVNDRDIGVMVGLIWLALIGVGTYAGYQESYKPAQQYANEQVTGKLVNFQPEGYNERSGKSRVDRHYMYVVYDVNGEQVILKAIEGVSYPTETVLYKN